MITIKDIQTPSFNKRTRRLLFVEITEELFLSAAAVKALGIEPGVTFDDTDVLLERVAEKEYEEAKNRALRLLSMRDHSQFEIKQKLLKESFQDKTILRVLENLSDYGLCDDARMLMHSLESELAKGLGINKIKMKLKIKGFSEFDIEEALELLCIEDYDQVASNTAKRLINKFDLDDRKGRDRAYRMLRNKGYTHEQTLRAIEEQLSR